MDIANPEVMFSETEKRAKSCVGQDPQGECADIVVWLPVSQYVRLEGAATEGKRSLESLASFLLSEWVNATHAAAVDAAAAEKYGTAPGERPCTSRQGTATSGRRSA